MEAQHGRSNRMERLSLSQELHLRTATGDLPSGNPGVSARVKRLLHLCEPLRSRAPSIFTSSAVRSPEPRYQQARMRPFGSSTVWPFGNATAISQFTDSQSYPYDTWQHALAAPGSADFQILGAMIDTYPWWSLVPDNTGITAGTATGAGDSAGALVIAYLPSGGSVMVDMGHMRGATTSR